MIRSNSLNQINQFDQNIVHLIDLFRLIWSDQVVQIKLITYIKLDKVDRTILENKVNKAKLIWIIHLDHVDLIKFCRSISSSPIYCSGQSSIPNWVGLGAMLCQYSSFTFSVGGWLLKLKLMLTQSETECVGVGTELSNTHKIMYILLWYLL